MQFGLAGLRWGYFRRLGHEGYGGGSPGIASPSLPGEVACLEGSGEDRLGGSGGRVEKEGKVPTLEALPAGLLRAFIPCQAACRPRGWPRCTGVPRLTPSSGLSGISAGSLGLCGRHARAPPDPSYASGRGGRLVPAAPGLTMEVRAAAVVAAGRLGGTAGRSTPRGTRATCRGTRGSHGLHSGASKGHPVLPWFPTPQSAQRWPTWAAVDASTPGRRELEAVTPHFKGPPIN